MIFLPDADVVADDIDVDAAHCRQRDEDITSFALPLR